MFSISRFLLIGIIIVSSGRVSGGSSMHQEPLKTVKNLDLNAYMGQWFQVAAIPQFFQRKCVRDTAAFYTRQGEKVSVLNTCRKENGDLISSKGRAWANRKFNDYARLKVTFVNFFGFWISAFGGNYWIINVGKNYEWSLVGDPKRRYLWILNRTPVMRVEQLLTLRSELVEQAYDTCKIILTQEGELDGRRLCDL